jgi:Calcineurin-like phosphoesterase
MLFLRKKIRNRQLVLATLLALTTAVSAQDIKLPLAQSSLRFAVIGDSGTGETPEFEIGREMEHYRELVKFDFVLMLGDNIYEGHRPGDFEKKFEEPFKPLLDAGVKFYASLGNHDDPDAERLYKPFNMGGKRYYSFEKNDVVFFALDSNYMDPAQLQWLESELQKSKKKWKIAYFHHPLYNAGKHHGPDLDLRSRLVPLFTKYGVNAVFSGHEHVYERMRPENNIYYFVLGNSGKLMTHDLKSSAELERSLDTDRSFMLIEIDGDNLNFQVISRGGQTIDNGVLQRQQTSSGK